MTRTRPINPALSIIPDGFTRVRKRKVLPKGQPAREFTDVLRELDDKYGKDNVVYIGSDARWFIFGVRETAMEKAS